MGITRVKNWDAGEVVTAQDLNNELNNLANNVLFEPFTATQTVDLNGQLLLLDADGNTLLDASTNNIIDVTIGGADDFRFEANRFSALAGSDIRLDQGNLVMTSGDVVMSSGRILEIKTSDVTANATITVPTTGNVFDIIGTTTISAFSATQQGTQFLVRFTGVGLNLTHNATSFIAPWGRDYRTVTNEVICFLSLGAGNYQFWSVNGPKERVGVTIEHNSTSVPNGYLPEDGAAISRTTFPGLYQEIGTTYGAGDGTTTFNVPLSYGLAVVNRDPSNSVLTSASTNGANAATLGGKGGAQTHTLSAAESGLVNHTHPQQKFTGGTGVGVTIGGGSFIDTPGADAGLDTQGSGSATASSAHSNTPPWIAKAKYIRF